MSENIRSCYVLSALPNAWSERASDNGLMILLREIVKQKFRRETHSNVDRFCMTMDWTRILSWIHLFNWVEGRKGRTKQQHMLSFWSNWSQNTQRRDWEKQIVLIRNIHNTSKAKETKLFIWHGRSSLLTLLFDHYIRWLLETRRKPLNS